MMELIIDKEVSSDDNLNCLSHLVLKEVVNLQNGRIRTYEEREKEKKKRKPLKV